MASSQCDSYLHFSHTSPNFTTSGRPAAASGSGQITTESGSIHSLVWLLTYSAFLLSHNTASTLSEPGQSLIRFGRVPGSENELISLAAPAVLCASACPRHQKTRAMRRCARFFLGRSLRTRSPLETRSCRTAASKSQTLSPATMQLRMATSKRRAVRAKMSGEGLAFSTSSPVKIGVSGGKFQAPVPSSPSRTNKTAGISVRPVSTGGMWRSQVSCFRIVPWTRPWLPGCAERLRNKPGMAIMLFANNSISLIGHLKERPYLLHFQADPH